MNRIHNQVGQSSVPMILFALGLLAWMEPAIATADDGPSVPGAPHLLPENTLFYARLDNANQLREDLASSSVGRMLSDPQLKPLATDMFAALADAFQNATDQIGVPLDDVLTIPTGQVAVAVMPGNSSERSNELLRSQSGGDESEEAIRAHLELKRKQQNSFAALFLVEAGDNIDDLMRLIDKLESTVIEGGYVRRTSENAGTEIIHLLPPRAASSELEYFVRDGTLIFGLGHRVAQDALDRWIEKNDDPTLADRTDFASVMSRCIGAEETRPQVTFFVDAYHLVERVVKRQSMAAFFWPLVDQLGLSKFRGIGGSLFRGGDDFESILHVHVLIDPPRDGLFGVLRPETVDTIPPDWIPSDVSSYTTLHWDFEKTYENLGKILAKFQQQGILKRNIEAPAQEILGASFQEDLLPNLTGRYVNCGWLERPIKLNSQSQTHAFELHDPQTANAALAKFHGKRPQDVSIETISGSVVYFINSDSMPGAERARKRREAAQARRELAGRPQNEASRQFRETLRKPEPCVVILGNWAVYSDSRKMMERLIQANRGSVDRLIAVPEYDLIISELGGKLDGEKPFLISFLKGADYVRQMYDLAQSPDTRKFLRARSKENPVAGQIVDLLERDELPPFEKFELYFAPSGFFGYDEPNGIHFGMFTLRAE